MSQVSTRLSSVASVFVGSGVLLSAAMVHPDPAVVIHKWTEFTARFSYVYFLLAFVGSSLITLHANDLTRWLRRNRRNLGISFAIAHTVHLIALVSELVFKQVNPGPVIILLGGAGYVLMYMMAFTSSDDTIKAMGKPAWTLLHSIGMHYLGLVFFIVYLYEVMDHPTSAKYLTLFSCIAAAYIIRIAAWYTRRGKPHKRTQTDEAAQEAVA